MGRKRTGRTPGNPGNARPLDPAAKCLTCGAYPQFDGAAWVIRHGDHDQAEQAAEQERVRKLAVALHAHRRHRSGFTPSGCPGPSEAEMAEAADALAIARRKRAVAEEVAARTARRRKAAAGRRRLVAARLAAERAERAS
jgi:hypothetical protein